MACPCRARKKMRFEGAAARPGRGTADLKRCSSHRRWPRASPRELCVDQTRESTRTGPWPRLWTFIGVLVEGDPTLTPTSRPFVLHRATSAPAENPRRSPVCTRVAPDGARDARRRWGFKAAVVADHTRGTGARPQIWREPPRGAENEPPPSAASREGQSRGVQRAHMCQIIRRIGSGFR